MKAKEPQQTSAWSSDSSTSKSSDSSSNIAFSVPDHELISPIASGAYGEVWLARNVVGTLRAVKIVRRDQHTSLELFEREFKGLQKFEPVSRAHEGLVDILTLGHLPDGAGFYYVMELADEMAPGLGTVGRDVLIAPRRAEDSPPYQPRTLRAELKSRGALPADEVIALGRKLTAALAHLHAHGLVHLTTNFVAPVRFFVKLQSVHPFSD